MFFQYEEFVSLRASSEGLTQKWAGLMVNYLIHSQTPTHSACIHMPRFLQVTVDLEVLGMIFPNLYRLDG